MCAFGKCSVNVLMRRNAGLLKVHLIKKTYMHAWCSKGLRGLSHEAAFGVLSLIQAHGRLYSMHMCLFSETASMVHFGV